MAIMGDYKNWGLILLIIFLNVSKVFSSISTFPVILTPFKNPIKLLEFDASQSGLEIYKWNPI